ncbi:hypothetical protein, partial [Cohnella fermenti]|uniref:hypothetical protein n=1 Tax=Cohnella fermenti TaxID=2565925 RepID=UPI001B3B2603
RYGFGYALHPVTYWKFTSFLFSRPDQLEKEQNDLTSTIIRGDPYWYEWSVGQSYIIDMLNPDSGIDSVVLQSNDIQGLDDVIVNRKDGVKEAYQIKHTRTMDTITFGDLVAMDTNGDSLLKNIVLYRGII